MTEQVMVEGLVPFIYASSLQVFIGHLLCVRQSERSKESDKVCPFIYAVIAEMRRTDTHKWDTVEHWAWCREHWPRGRRRSGFCFLPPTWQCYLGPVTCFLLAYGIGAVPGI